MCPLSSGPFLGHTNGLSSSRSARQWAGLRCRVRTSHKPVIRIWNLIVWREMAVYNITSSFGTGTLRRRSDDNLQSISPKQTEEQQVLSKTASKLCEIWFSANQWLSKKFHTHNCMYTTLTWLRTNNICIHLAEVCISLFSGSAILRRRMLYLYMQICRHYATTFLVQRCYSLHQ